MNNKVHYGTFLGQFFPRNMEIANDRVDNVPKQSREAIEQDIGSVSHPISKWPLLNFTLYLGFCRRCLIFYWSMLMTCH